MKINPLSSLIVAAALMVAPAAHAISFNFTVDHSTSGLGSPPFGTVTLTQNGTSVDFNVSLVSGLSFVKTGAGDFMNFKFNGNGVALSDITIDAHVPALAASQGTYNGNGTGTFNFGITAPSQPNGGGSGYTAPIVFHVANAVIADFLISNDAGFVFAADVYGNTGTGPGSTGPIAVPYSDTPPPVPDGGTTLVLLGGALAVLASARRFIKA